MSVKLVIFFVLRLLVLCSAKNNSGCRTPRGTFGVCKEIRDCPIVVNALQTNTLDDKTKQQIQQYKCEETISGIPKVCCENDANPCKTPEHTAGICVPLNRCPSLANLLEQKPFLSNDVVEYLKTSECSSPDTTARVCCPFIEQTPKIQKRNDGSDSLLPKPNDCGIQVVELKIIGGTKTDLAEFPWMALLEYGPKEKPNLACGGTLISLRFVLTAGHCIQGPTAGRYGRVQRIRLGEYNIFNETDCFSDNDFTDCTFPLVRIDVENVAVHENFVANSLTREHDIAIIKMKEEAEFTDFVRPICLPTPNHKLPSQFNVAGWGSTLTSDQSADKLKVVVPYYDKINCTNLYSKLLRGINLGRGQICAGGVVGKDSCTGDSGGPLMAGLHENLEQIWYQFGVISFGPTPCGKPYPAVYTLVSDYVPWIKKQINKLS